MSDLPRLTAATALHEGFRPTSYRDTNNLWTFAIGRCLETHPLTGAEFKYLLDQGWLQLTITRPGADWLSVSQLQQIEADLARAYSFWPTLNNARQNALIEMAYQMGEEKEEAFHVMIAAIAEGRWADAEAAGLDSKWAKIDSPGRARVIMAQLRSGVFA